MAIVTAIVLGELGAVVYGQSTERHGPLHRTVELNIGEAAEVELVDHSRARINLIAVEEIRDRVRSALREARVTVEINGVRATIVSAN
jgi:hypothetical protein